ncbi:MAG: hypothetical protein JNM93_09385 [Bacteriovoracaceae bacterium]|nr:hypothetical protein [Bacteriovoracaceae bacterium]
MQDKKIGEIILPSGSATQVREYLKTPLNKGKCALTTNQNINFHWADYSLTCDLYRDLVKKDSKFHQAHNSIVMNLEKLKTVPVWVKTIDNVTTLSLYDIYDALATKGKMSRFYVNKANKLVISFAGPNGPFEVLSPSECVNLDRYTDFIFSYLLQGKIPTRDFRLRCQGKVGCYYDVCFNKQTEIDVEQITSDGILFSTKDNELKNKLLYSKEIKILMNLDLFHKVLKKSFNELRNAFSDYRFNLFFTRDSRHSYHVIPKHLYFYQAYDHDMTGITYIYCYFQNFKGNNDVLENILKEFTDQIRNQLKEEIFNKAA